MALRAQTVAAAFISAICPFTSIAAAEPVHLVSSQTAGANPAGLFSTGLGADGRLLVENEFDPHYTIVSGPVVGSTSVVETDGFPIDFGLWFANGPRSQWIAPPLVGADDNAVGTYNYRTEFWLDPLGPVNLVIHGLWSSDNSGLDILINGLSTGNTNTAVGEFTFVEFRRFRIGNGFRSGRNTLEFLVRNAPCGGCQNPSGLRVEFEAGPVPEPATFLLFATGAAAIGRRAWKRKQCNLDRPVG